MRFGSWYSLGDAGNRAPAGEGVLQLRLDRGLLDYPRGKSAMLWYAHARDVRTAALALATRYAGSDYLCRHLIEIDETVDLAEFYEKLRADFVRRFGAAPEPNPR